MFHIIKMHNHGNGIRRGEKMFKNRKKIPRQDLNEKLLQIERQALNVNGYIKIEPFGTEGYIVYYIDNELTFTIYEIENMSVEEIVRKIEIVAKRYGYSK